MKMYRPLGLIYVISTNQLLYCFNAFTLVSGGTPAQQEQTAVQELFLHRRFINSYALL